LKDNSASAVFVIECDHANGVRRTPFLDWINHAGKKGLDVVYLPIAKNLPKDESNLWKWLDQVNGMYFDYGTEFFAAFDDGSLPPPFNAEILPVLLRLEEKWGFGDRLLRPGILQGMN
jgi:hypothetical protein